MNRPLAQIRIERIKCGDYFHYDDTTRKESPSQSKEGQKQGNGQALQD